MNKKKKSRKVSKSIVIKKISMRLNGKIRTFEPQKTLNLKGKDLETEILKQSSLMFFWSRQRDKVRAEERTKIDELVEMKGEKFIHFQEYLSKRAMLKGEYVSRAYCTAQVDTDPEILNIKEELRGIQEQLDALQSIVDALRQRASILLTLHAKQRKWED